MKLSQVIAQIKNLKPNAYSDLDLIGFVSDLEKIVQAEVLNIESDDIRGLNVDDLNKELLIKAPYEDCYRYYVASVIDFNNQETAGYENNRTMFNARFAEFKKASKRRKQNPANLRLTGFWK